MRKSVYVVGAGGLGRETRDILDRMRTISSWRFGGFIDDDLSCPGSRDRNFIKESKEDYYVVAVGDPKIRKELVDDIESCNSKLQSVVDNTVIYRPCGAGCIVFPNSFISTNTKVEKSIIVYSNVYVGHDSLIKSFTTICPGVNIGGWANIGQCCFLGIGSTISSKVSICDNVYVGAGACVVKNITDPGTYVGVPARKIHD